jgi:multidrug efflux system outer membrane protein
MTIRTTGRENRRRGRASRIQETCRLVACVAAIGVAGCTMGPDYKRPDVPVPPAWRTEMPEAADVANTSWWEGFNDPDLTALIVTALEQNSDLKVATLRIEEYDAKYAISRSAKYPQIGYESEADRQRRSQERPNGLQPGQDPTLANFEIGGNFNWELDLWGRVKRSNEAALANLLSTEESRRGVMLSVVASVAQSYVQLLELDRQLALAQQAVKNRQDALNLIQEKYKGGSGNLIAVAQARAAVEEEISRIPRIEQQIATGENALSALIGRSPGGLKRGSMDTLKLPRVPQGVPSDVLRRRPDVLSAEQNLVAANAMIGVAKTQYFPTISLTGALGLGSDELKYLWAETARTANIGAQLVGPIFNGGRTAAEVRQAEVVQKEMTVRYQQSVSNAVQEVDDALVSRVKTGEREAAIGRQVASLQDMTKLARARYDGGQSSFIEVLESDLLLYGAESRQAQSRRDTFLALISVYKAMGGGWMVEQDKLRAAAEPQVSGGQGPAATETRASQ